MYCPNCNTYNEDKGNFCSNCGAPLHAQQPPMSNTGYQAPQGTAYAAPQGGAYQQPYSFPMREMTSPISIAMPVVALVLNFIFFNVIGLVLAGLSLMNYNSYESEKVRGGMALAETYKRKCKHEATWAIVVAVLTLLLFVVLGLVFVFLMAEGASQEYPEAFNEFFVDSYLWIS